jgi:hypothetical protein
MRRRLIDLYRPKRTDPHDTAVVLALRVRRTSYHRQFYLPGRRP